MDNENGSIKLGIIGLLVRKEEQEVLSYITITPQGIPIGGHTSTQVHPLLGSIIGLVWMSYKEK
jgi:hypothetical protein